MAGLVVVLVIAAIVLGALGLSSLRARPARSESDGGARGPSGETGAPESSHSVAPSSVQPDALPYTPDHGPTSASTRGLAFRGQGLGPVDRAPASPGAPSGGVQPKSGDQRRLEDLLIRFEQSQTGSGGDARVRSAVLAIAQAGSLPESPVHARTNKEYIIERSKKVGDSSDEGRPWRWIAAVTEEAERDENLMLTAHSALFTFFYHAMSSQHTVADQLDVRLPGPTRVDRSRIYAVALRALPRLDQRRYVVRHSDENSMQVRDVLRGCAVDALEIKAVLDPTTVLHARRILAG